MVFREPRTPNAKTPSRRDTMDSGAVPRNSFAPASSSAALQRRSSVFRAVGANTAIFKDKRNLVAAPTKQANIIKIHSFMNGELSMEEVKNPTRKHFLMMFEYIYGSFNDNYSLPRTQEEQNAEIIKQLKNMGYPVILKNSTLQSVNAPTSWPHMLGALSWMVDLAEFSQKITLEPFMNECENNALLRYSMDAKCSKEFQERKRDDMSEEEKEALLVDIIRQHIPQYRGQLKRCLDFESKMAEAKERATAYESEKEILELEKQNDLCEQLQGEIKEIDTDIGKLEQYMEQLAQHVGSRAGEVEKQQRIIEAVDAKIAETNARIEEKKAQIARQTTETGLDSAAIRALAMDNELIKSQIAAIQAEMHKLSKFRYNISSKATEALKVEQDNYRRLLVPLYKVRQDFLGDSDRSLSAPPGDIKSLIEVVSTDVRRLFSRTKKELEARLADTEAHSRKLSTEQRRVLEEGERVEREQLAEAIAIEREEKIRAAEREDWAREQKLREREKNALDNEKETLAGAQMEVGKLNQLINEAALDLEETQHACKIKKVDFDRKFEDRAIELMCDANEIEERRTLIDENLKNLEKFMGKKQA